MKRPISSDHHPSFVQTVTKLLAILGLILLLMLLWSAPVAIANVQFLKEADQWVYQSQQTLTDTIGNHWEVTALKPMAQDSEDVYLWLTTQSDSVYLDAAQPLIIETDLGQKLSVPNLTQRHFMGELPAPNVSQYDIHTLIPYIQDVQSLQLQLPTKTENPVRLSIPPNVLEEWLIIGTCKGLICVHL
ncbi:DUF3122 domain-containing protein [Leptolyngbya cf. ectocarpi LEGE 11479]|uniref:DUF3122 domain-containing protein n=1 Tax=Leptolyngbya cf. ectocarpi LEGE 11479 TaxID=1828722 RepID=A0A929FB91_LEPEC|nr:DUF3122 domain-containing protein [Leptolyngbya ectocarpi]MBE9070970.1 DUF3122 domain-containing protein [Leptolyngbya cf. ectocarpi LEGE 11479]